jgi:diguanylate cyclase (GGDEF)-like protein
VAERLSALVRRADTVARFGGDEFVIILAGLDDPAETLPLVVAKVRSAMAQPFAVGELRLRLGVSVGSAVYPDEAQDAETLLSLADHAMYAVKSAERVR